MSASPSKRSTRVKQSLTGGVIIRRQYRCRKCPDNPLLKDCLVHGKKNKELQKPQTRKCNTSLPSPASGNGSAELEHGEGMQQDAEPNPIPHPSPTAQNPDLPEDAMLIDDENIDPRLRGLQADGTRRATTLQAGVEVVGGEGSSATHSNEELLATPAATPPTMVENTRHKNKQATDGGDDDNGDDEDNGDDDDDDDWENEEEDGDENAKGGGPHGFIEGVMRGNYDFRGLKRSTALRPPSQTSTHASKRFHRVIRQILTRVENLAVETGCWIYIAAQHATAVTPYIHYASPRLRAEAGPELDIIHTNFSIIMKTLIMARRREVMELTLELEENREQLHNAQKDTENARREAEEHRAESARKDAVIARLMAQINQ
ncbi:hypothetical protein NP233_g5045 [Leucocoprinus birnbaumii]|uniref:Uncharacterized protein n=1 Tax=Leucocoprinus birnbaumii TaxID=56174 RepID=A0AAD5YX28_9AGAR|nr:hypothetical protein NP233_g5045 [Leucocoprinus birnbaumii]